MKKMIYAVKNGRKTGIFNEWLKCSKQTNKYPNAKFRRFEYQSGLEDEPEDISGSLRHAIKEAEKFLEDLVYLGESADYLEDRSWVENGFLPFGDESEADNPELFSDRKEQEEEADTDEEYSKWLSDSRDPQAAPPGYWKTAQDMKECINIIRSRQNDSVRAAAAASLKRYLEKCLLDTNLSDLTALYKDMEEKNVIGYNPSAAAEFVSRLAARYPKPETAEEVEDEVSIRQIFMQAGAIETELKDRMQGQDAAIEKLSEAYFHTELKACLTPDRRGPGNAYLLAGPPGVGKTLMAQQFAFRLGFPFKRFDMSEYSHHYKCQYKNAQKFQNNYVQFFYSSIFI